MEIDEENGQMSIPGMPNERMMLPLLKKKRPVGLLPAKVAVIEWGPFGATNWIGYRSNHSSEGHHSIANIEEEAPTSTVDEESVVDLSFPLRYRHGYTSSIGGSCIDDGLEESKERNRRYVGPGFPKELALEDKVLTSVKRALEFPVSERILRRVIHSMIIGQPSKNEEVKLESREIAGASAQKTTEDIDTVCRVNAPTKICEVIDVEMPIEQTLNRRTYCKKKKTRTTPAYKKFGLAFPIKDLQPYAAAAPHMTEKDWAAMPLPLHGFHNVVQLPPIPMMSLKWGAGHDLVMMRGLHDVLADTRKNVPSVIAMDRQRYLRRIGAAKRSK